MLYNPCCLCVYFFIIERARLMSLESLFVAVLVILDFFPILYRSVKKARIHSLRKKDGKIR